MVVGRTWTDDVSVSVNDSNAYIAFKFLSLVLKVSHIQHELFVLLECFIGSLRQRQIPLSIEHQLRVVFEQFGSNGFYTRFVGVSKNSHDVAIEGERAPAKLTARLRNIERSNGVKAIALPVPSEVHVKESTVVEAVGYPCVPRDIAFGVSRNINGKACTKFAPQNFSEAFRSFGCAHYISYAIVEIFF